MKNWKYTEAERDAFIERQAGRCQQFVHDLRTKPRFTDMPDYPAAAFNGLTDREIMHILIEALDLIAEEKKRKWH